MAEVLVVGGNGFIGSHVVDALASRGHQVAAFDRFGPQEPIWAASGVRPLVGDFLNVGDVRSAVRGRDVVVHLLSTTDPATAQDDPTLDVRTNVLASIALFEACAEAGVGHVVFASTGGAIYGDQDRQVFRETDPALPVSPYAIGKLAIEGYLRFYRRTRGLDSTVVRISNPYGPRQNPRKRQGVIPIFLRQIARDEPLTVLGDGSMVRDYVYVADVAAMIADVVEGGGRHDLYNLGSGQGTALTELLEVVARVTGREPRVEHRPQPPTFVDHVTLDTTRFTQEFGVPTLTSMDDGVARTWEEVRAHG